MKLCTSLVAGLLILTAGLSTAQGDTTIVNENFDSYPSWDVDPSQAAFHAAWRPDNGDGIVSMFSDPTEAGFVVPNTGGFLNAPNDNPPGIQGNAIALVTATHESTATFSLIPTATQWITYGGDIFNDGAGVNDSPSGMRQSIGLRNDTFDRDPATPACDCGVNFVEMGYYNLNGTDTRPDPDVPVPNAQFQVRLALHSAVPPDNIPAPSPEAQNWISFVFDPALDVPTGQAGDGDYNDDNKVDAADYVVWRKAGPNDTLLNDPTPGTVDATDYDVWRANFGEPQGDGIVNLSDIGAGWHTFSAVIKPESITVEVDLYRDGINNATGEAGIDASETWPLQMNTTAGAAGAYTSLRFGGPSGVSPNDQAVFDNIFLKTIDAPLGAGSSVVPEPASIALAALGMICVVGGYRRRPR